MQQFNMGFIVIFIVSLGMVYLVDRASPNLNPLIKFLVVPLLTAYLTMLIVNNIFPHVNSAGNNIGEYIKDATYNSINSTGYIQMYPPLFCVLILFMILLYSKMLG